MRTAFLCSSQDQPRTEFYLCLYHLPAHYKDRLKVDSRTRIRSNGKVINRNQEIDSAIWQAGMLEGLILLSGLSSSIELALP